eukprot:1144894-Pelagomonas_calceolata.AAC.7
MQSAACSGTGYAGSGHGAHWAIVGVFTIRASSSHSVACCSSGTGSGTRGTGSTHGAYWLTAGSSGAISTGGIGALSDDPRMKSILAR